MVGAAELELAASAAHRGPERDARRGGALRGHARSRRGVGAIERMPSKPGRLSSSRRTWDGRGVNFALFSEHAAAVDLCLFDAAGARDAHPRGLAHASRLARLRARARVRAALRLARPRPVRARSRAPLQPRTSCSSIPTRASSTARSTCAGPSTAIRASEAVDDRVVRRARRRARASRKSVVVDDALRLGRRPPAARPLARHGGLRAARARASPSCTRASPSRCAARSSASRRTRRSRTSRRSASRPWSSCPCTQRADEPALVARGPHELLGLQHALLLRARRPLRDRARRRRARVQGDGEAPARRRASRSCSTSSTTTPARATASGPTVTLPRHRQPRLLPPRAASARAATSTSPAAATRSTPRIRRCSSSSPTACATGSPRCTSTASASTSRPRSRAATDGDVDRAQRVLRGRCTRTRCSRASSSSPSRGTSGDGGYQVGNFPVSWIEWNGRFRDTRAPLLARRPQGHRRPRVPPHRVERSLRGRRAPPAREHQLRDGARRLHAARSRELREEAQRGQRREQRATAARRQPQPELRRRGGDGRRARASRGAGRSRAA